LISERIKFGEYSKLWVNRYFWRTHNQQEIDYIEEGKGIMNAFEFKWNPKKKGKFSRVFSNHYPSSTFTTINTKNFQEFINA
jgi:hypothetical protein